MEIGNEELAGLVRDKLGADGVWYRDINKTTIEVSSPPDKEIIKYINSASKALLPEGRSASFPKAMLIEITNGLNKLQIDYKLVEFDAGPWLVWEEKDATSVNEIIDVVSENTNIQEISESDFKYKLN